MGGTQHRRQLSSRPRLLRGLTLTSRTPTQAQLGHGIAVHGTEHVYRQLDRLDGTHSYTELLQAAAEPEELRMLVERLDELRLLEDDAHPGRLAGDLAARALHGSRTETVAAARGRATIVVHGDGRIGISVAMALAAAGIGWVRPATTGTVRAEDCGTGYRETDVGKPRARVARELLRSAASAARHDKLPPARTPDLVVFTDTPVPDPAAVAPLTGSGVAQLLAYPRDEVGVVGPLVLPGETGCTRCVDLWRTGRDPCWPRLATQYAGVAQPCPLAVANTVSAFACAQALRFIDGDRLEQLHDAAFDIEPDIPSLRRRSWYANPACLCGGSAAADAPRPSGESHPAPGTTPPEV